MDKILSSSLTLTLLVSTAAGDVTVFEATGPTTGNVVVLDETGISPEVRPAELQGIRLLPLDVVGRTRLDQLRSDKPQLVQDVPGAARVLLPLGQGSLYRYSRNDAGSTLFGYFVVGADGAGRLLWERPGTGAGAQTDPIATRVAVAVDPAGGAFLVGTTIAAGGDLLEVSLTGGAVDRTSTLGAFDFRLGGVTLLPDWGVAAAANVVVRFDREPGAAVSVVPFAGGASPAFLEGSFVASADGKRVAFVAGDAPGSAHVWVAGPTGVARRVTTNPGAISGAGFLPESPAGPTLALSPDGTICAWREEGVAREGFVKLVQAPNQAPLQITADERFVDTLDDTGVLAFVGLSTLILIVGERDQGGTGHIEGGDFYRLDLGGHFRRAGGGGGGAAAALSNGSGTSGDMLVPFTPGELDTDTGFMRIPGTTAVLVPIEGSSGAGSLHRFDWASGSFDTLLPDVRELQLVQAAGSHLLLGMRRSFADDRRDLASLAAAPGSVPTVIASLPDDTEFNRYAARSDGTVALVAELAPDEFAGRVHLPSGAGALLSNQPRTYGPAQGFAPDGSLVTTIVLANGTSLFVVWRPSGAKALLTQPVAGHLLPGA